MDAACQHDQQLKVPYRLYYRLPAFPTILGAGDRLFRAGTPPAYLEVLSAEQAGAAVLTRYRRAR